MHHVYARCDIRSAGLWEAVRSLKASVGPGASVDGGGADVGVGGDGGGVGGGVSVGVNDVGVNDVGVDDVNVVGGGGSGRGDNGTKGGSASPSCALASPVDGNSLARDNSTNEDAAGAAGTADVAGTAGAAGAADGAVDGAADGDADGAGGAGAAGPAVIASSFAGSIDVETLPDVPDNVLVVNCKVCRRMGTCLLLVFST